MSDLSPVIIALCGLSIICVGLFVIGATLLARFAGINVIAPLLGMVLGHDTEGDEAASQEAPLPRPTSSPSRDLRAKARSLDFDSAVARHQQEGGPASAQSADRPRKPLGRSSRRALGDEEASSSGSLHRRRRDEESEYEIFDDDDSG